MKKSTRLVIILSVLLMSSSLLKAQTMQMTEKTIIKDSAGNVLPMMAWMQKLQTGKYSVKPAGNGEKDTYILYRLPKGSEVQVKTVTAGDAPTIKTPEPAKKSKLQKAKPLKKKRS